MPPRLKVFVTSDGLTDFVVAATSKAKALAAWGVRQDVFREGLARETDDPELTAEAAARPGEVLRRPAGTRGELAKLRPAKTPTKPKGPSSAQLKKIAVLEQRLSELDARCERESTGLDRQRAELEARARKLQADYAAAREKLERELSAARRAPG